MEGLLDEMGGDFEVFDRHGESGSMSWERNYAAQ